MYSVIRIEGALLVVAYLSEEIPRFWLVDNSALGTWGENEPQYGLQVAVETKVLDRHQRRLRDPDAGVCDQRCWPPCARA